MISFLLLKKIAAMFLIMAFGVLAARTKKVPPETGKYLSAITVYIVIPCQMLDAFQTDFSREKLLGLLLALGGGLAVHILFYAASFGLKKPLKLSPVEEASAMYTNCGGLILPIVSGVLGPEYVIYAIAYTALDTVCLWSIGRVRLCPGQKPSVGKLLLNPNILSTLAGLALFLLGIRFPEVIGTALGDVAKTIGPLSMIILGLVMGNTEWKDLTGYRRVWIPVALRLAGFPLLAFLLYKYSGLASLVPDGNMILLVSLLGAIAPSASTVVQLTQLNGGDSRYAGVINVITTLLCIGTMPLWVYLYQL